jgi:hypothetical protein
MLFNKVAAIGLLGFSASAFLVGNPVFAQTVNQEINGSAVGPDTFVNGSNLTINPTGTLNQLINCEARNYGAPVDPRCDASNTAIYGSHGNTHPKPPKDHHNHVPNVNQNVENGGTNTTVIAPATANSSSSSRSDSSSTSNANATIRDSGNSRNTNLNVSQGGDARIGDQKNQMSVTTGASTVSPSTKVKVDGDQYNSIQFGSQAPGTGGEAFSFQYRSACGTAVNYRQGFALKPRRIGGGGFGYALDISNTEMDTIENRGSVQNKMNTAFQTAIGVVSNQQAFEQRLNTGGVSRQEAETHAIANCTPVHRSQESVQITSPPIDKPRNCTTQGCN